jgi:hypothetical protein
MDGGIFMKKFNFLLLMVTVYCGSIFAAEETITDYTTYQTRITNKDIVEAFKYNVNTYWKRNSYYLCQYQIYQGSSDQNYSWRLRVIKSTYDWGTVFSLRFDVSNGYFLIKLSNTPFTSNGVDANQMTEDGKEIGVYHTSHSYVFKEYQSFVQESIMTLKMNNDDYGRESREAFEVFYGVVFIY